MSNDDVDYKKKLDTFTYSISHDLQEPIRMIRSYSTLIKSRYWDDVPEHVQEFLGYVLDGSDRLQIMMDALLDISRIQNNEHKLTNIELDTVIAKCKRNLSELIDINNATVDGENLGEVYSNRSLLIRLLTELIKNSIIFNENIPAIKIECSSDKNFSIITIYDNSISIPEESNEKAQKLFSKLNARDEYPGVGAGLYICTLICEVHGGGLQLIKSDEGQIAKIYLPLEQDGAGAD